MIILMIKNFSHEKKKFIKLNQNEDSSRETDVLLFPSTVALGALLFLPFLHSFQIIIAIIMIKNGSTATTAKPQCSSFCSLKFVSPIIRLMSSFSVSDTQLVQFGFNSFHCDLIDCISNANKMIIKMYIFFIFHNISHLRAFE